MVNSVSVSWLLPSLQLKVHSETQAQRNPLALTAELFNHLSVGPGPWISVNKHSIEIISSLLCSAVSFFHTLGLLSFPLLLSPYPFSFFLSPQDSCVMEVCFLLLDMARLITSSIESLYCVDFFHLLWLFVWHFDLLSSLTTLYHPWHITMKWILAILDVVFSHQTVWFCYSITLKKPFWKYLWYWGDNI